MNEVAYYPEIAVALEREITANLNGSAINVKVAYLPTYGSQLRQFLAAYIEQATETSAALQVFARDVPKIRTDLAIILDNPSKNAFEIVIVEAKLVSSAGLSELSQLIGYSLVSKTKYGLLLNINSGISNDLSMILETDADIVNIDRRLVNSDESSVHKFGVVKYSSETKQISNFPTRSVRSLATMIEEIEDRISG